jgi:hypothetical protein
MPSQANFDPRYPTSDPTICQFVSIPPTSLFLRSFSDLVKKEYGSTADFYSNTGKAEGYENFTAAQGLYRLLGSYHAGEALYVIEQIKLGLGDIRSDLKKDEHRGIRRTEYYNLIILLINMYCTYLRFSHVTFNITEIYIRTCETWAHTFGDNSATLDPDCHCLRYLEDGGS